MLDKIDLGGVKDATKGLIARVWETAKAGGRWVSSVVVAMGDHIAAGFAFAIGFFTLFHIFPAAVAWLGKLSLAGLVGNITAAVSALSAFLVGAILVVAGALFVAVKVVFWAITIVIGLALILGAVSWFASWMDSEAEANVVPVR
jgi:hypothetical protein